MMCAARGLIGAVSVSFGCLAAQGAFGVDHRLNLRHGAFDPLDGAVVPAGFEIPSTGRSFLVQLHDEITAAARRALAELDVEIHWFAPERAFVVRMDPARAAAVQALACVRWVGPYHPFFRLEPGLVAAVRSARLGPRRYVIALLDRRVDAPALESAIERLGGRLHIRGGGGLVVEATLDQRQLMAIAGRDEVLAIELWTEPGEDMDNCRIQTGVDYVEAVAGIDGKGMRGHIHEGVYASHTEFAARPPYRSLPIAVADATPSTHGTGTAGIVFARGAFPQAKGILPFGQMLYTHYLYVLNNDNRYALTRDLVDPSGPYRVMFQTSSWGYSRTLAYDVRSAEMDTILFDFPLFITQTMGDSGNPQSRPQAWAKNVTAVSGHYHYDNTDPADDAWGGGASTGPASDGRIAVSFTAYYDATYTTWDPVGYRDFGGSSGATPMVCGLGGVAIQMFTDGLFGYRAAPSWASRFDYLPKFTTTKMLLATTAEQLAYSRANRFQQGWGFPNVKNLFDERHGMLVIDELDVLPSGGSRTYFVFGRGGAEFRAGMTHSDPPAAAPFAGPHRVNSLDLRVVAPDGASYWGNNGLTTGSTSVAGGVANDRDTEELVIVERAARGLYRVEVSAPVVRLDGHVETPAVDADYALVVRGLGGLRDRSGPVLDLLSTQPGDFRIGVTGLPPGFAIGYVLWSTATSRPPGTGNLLGVEADPLTLTSLGLPPTAGSPFAFRQTGNPALFPNTGFAFPPAVANALRGVTVDAAVCLFDASANMVAASNVDRLTVQ